jgi:Uma2 family endonuclease
VVAMSATEHPVERQEPAGGSEIDKGLLAAFEELSTPEGFRAELIDGEIIVTPPPDGEHEEAVAAIAEHFYRSSCLRVRVSGTKGLEVPGGRFIPDGTVAEVGHFRGAPPWAPPDGVLLVFEVTSSHPAKDRDAKRRGYAAAGIPCYLLVDRDEAKVTLFTDPEGEDYTAIKQVAFGKSLDLPEPFSFALDTAELL